VSNVGTTKSRTVQGLPYTPCFSTAARAVDKKATKSMYFALLVGMESGDSSF